MPMMLAYLLSALSHKVSAQASATHHLRTLRWRLVVDRTDSRRAIIELSNYVHIGRFGYLSLVIYNRKADLASSDTHPNSRRRGQP